MDTVYLETSIVSHATAWPSSVPAVAALQDQAKRWMNEQRPLYDVVTSQVVIDEAAMGDPMPQSDDWRCFAASQFSP